MLSKIKIKNKELRAGTSSCMSGNRQKSKKGCKYRKRIGEQE